MYKKEFAYNWKFLALMMTLLLMSFSVYLFSDETVTTLGSEENLFEGLTCIFFLSASVLFLAGSRRNFWLIALGLVFFFGAGEEISWGQRIFGFQPPDSIREVNVQEEFNVHNLPLFNGTKYKGQHVGKKGLERLLEMNFLFRLFIMSFGILWPLLVYHVKPVSRLAQWLNIPVPPVSLGIFFALSWLAFRLVLQSLPQGHTAPYYWTSSEIFEFLASFVSLLIAVYFFRHRKEDILGKDIKQTALLA